jgi:hypothetical protein
MTAGVALVGLWLLLLAGCAPISQSSPLPQAHARMKVRGPEVVIVADGQTHYFQNLHPHCLAYTLPGEWEFAYQEAALRTPDTRHEFVGVLLWGVVSLPGPPSADPVERAAAYYQADTAKDWGGPVPSTVEPFPQTRPGAVLLQFSEVVVTSEAAARALGPEKPKVGERVGIQKRVIAPLMPGVLIVVTVSDVALARSVLETLEITEDPQCWRGAIRERFPGIRP